jgi:hypothetical protein
VAPLDDSFDLSLAAASLRSNSTDVQMLLRALSLELADTLGAQLRVEHAGGRLRKSNVISSVRIGIGGDEFEAAIDGSRLRCVIGHISGGIRIRNESIDMDQWLVRLLGALQREAEHNESARQALENIVIGGHQ